MTRTRTLSLLAAGCLVAASCAGSDDAADSTDAPADTTAPADTAAPVDNTEVATTDAAPATDAPPETEPPAELPTEAQPITVQPRGTNAYVSTQSFDDTVDAAVAAIEGNENLTLVANIDHRSNAESAGLELPPTVELIFGNPALGTPIMASEPTAGIDLPQKMLIVEDADGTVTVLWNRTDYLASRHGLGISVDEQLTTIAGALQGIAAGATGVAEDAEPTESVTVVGERQGLIETTASGTARDAADRLLGAIDGNPDLVLVAEVDHAANAESVGMELSPIIEVIFGNPALGTPLMFAGRTAGIDLPQKMLFIEDGDDVRILYNDPEFVARRHGIDRDAATVMTISGALENLASAAAG